MSEEKKMPDCVWVNNHNGYLVGENYPNSTLYFSEEAVRSLLRDEYKQANNIIRFASRCESPIDEDLIGVEQSIESAIKRLKGGTK